MKEFTRKTMPFFSIENGLLIIYLLLSSFGLQAQSLSGFGEQQVISESTTSNLVDVHAVDLDGDGVEDILSYAKDQHKLSWFKNNGSGSFGKEEVISTYVWGEMVAPVDIDKDKDVDIVFNSSYNKISWLKNEGNGKFSEQHLIALVQAYAGFFAVGDLDNDDDQDVISFDSDGNPVWFSNNGEGEFSGKKSIGEKAGYISKRIRTYDLNNDGNLDIVYEYTDKVFAFGSTYDLDYLHWYSNDGTGSFSESKLIPIEIVRSIPRIIKSFDFANLDNDSKPDLILVLNSYSNNIYWYKNAGFGNFTIEETFPDFDGGIINDFLTSDLDGDGDQDIAASGQEKIYWLRNDSNGFFDLLTVHKGDQDEKTNISDIGDLNNDGAPDLIFSEFNKLAWYENFVFPFGGPNNISPVLVKEFQNMYFEQGFEETKISLNESFFDINEDSLKLTAKVSPEDVVSLKILNDTLTIGEINTGVADIIVTANDRKGGVVSDTFSIEIIKSESIEFGVNNSGFGEEQVIHETASNSVRDVHTADIDGDGHQDIISASGDDAELSWYKGDGSGNFGEQQIIDTNAGEASWTVYIKPVDLDKDGDIDIVWSSFEDDKIGWYENDGTGIFGEQQYITNTLGGPREIVLEDFDGDGILDLVASSYYQLFNGKVFSFMGGEGGKFKEGRPIDDQYSMPWGIFAEDIDGDGDPDVLACSYRIGQITWCANNGSGEFERKQTLEDDRGTRWVMASDLDNDGDQDIVSANLIEKTIKWSRNDGEGNFEELQLITDDANGVFFYLDDIDGDSYIDLLTGTANDQELVWLKNDGNGSFSSNKTITSTIHGVQSIHTSDLDGDGDMDVVSGSFIDDKVAYYLNDGIGNFGVQHILTESTINGPGDILAIDIDLDKDQDIVTCSENQNAIYLFRNRNNLFDTLEIIVNNAEGVYNIKAADLNNDSIPDFIASYRTGNKLSWYPNNGSVNFKENIIISGLDYLPRLINAADLDKDGDLDIIYTFFNNYFWHKNDGQGNFGEQIKIASELSINTNNDLADFDSDGDLDFIIAVHDRNTSNIVLLGNNGDGTFTSPDTIISQLKRVNSVKAVDFDKDGDKDFIFGGREKVVWFRNDGGNFRPEQYFRGYFSGLKVVDFDQDGEYDFLTRNWDSKKFRWYRNLGNGKFMPHKVITTSLISSFSTSTADLNGDSYPDLLFSSKSYDKIAWHENMMETLKEPDNYPPALADTFPDLVMDEGFDSLSISLSNKFTDPDGDSLTFSVQASGEGVVDVAIADTFLLISELDTGRVVIIIMADDGREGVFSDSFTFTINEVINQPPIINHQPADTTAAFNQNYQFTLPDSTFSDPEGDELVLSATLEDGSPLPSWLSFDPETGTFSGTPSENDFSTYRLKVTATDAENSSVSTTFVLNVARPTASHDRRENLFSINPNPTSGNIHLKLPQHWRKANIEILSAKGELLMTVKHRKPKLNIDISAYPPGIYLIRISKHHEERMYRVIKK